jgi:hypothetical protein
MEIRLNTRIVSLHAEQAQPLVCTLPAGEERGGPADQLAAALRLTGPRGGLGLAEPLP